MHGLTLYGSSAFRDLGGTPTGDGRRIAYGRLFRSDELSGLDDADRARILGIGLRLVCDLRSGSERDRTPCLDWLAPAPRRLDLELSAGLSDATTRLVDQLRRGPSPEAATAMMRATYAELPRAAGPSLASLFEALVAGEVPALVHCTAGKDRTGFMVAMVLTALGVDPQFVYDDYLRGSGLDPLARDQPSSRMLLWLLGRPLEPEEAMVIHGVRREYLDAAFAAIVAGWGDVPTYFEQAAGLDHDRTHVLRQHLLD